MASGMRLVKKPPPAGKQYDFFRKEVVKQLEGRVADRRPDEYNKSVSFFKSNHRPVFKSQVVAKGDKIFIRTILTNGSKIVNKYGLTIRKLWDIWNKGSRPHLIRPRFAKVLRFIARNGKLVFTKLVHHPGTRGSKAQEGIDKRLLPFERRGVDRAIRIALKRLEKFSG